MEMCVPFTTFKRSYHFQAIHGHIFKFWRVKSQSLGGERLRNGPQGPVSRKSRNFTGHFRMSQFPLYLKNGEDLSRQTSHLVCFCYLENILKDRLSWTSDWQIYKWLSGPEKFSEQSRNGPQALSHKIE